MRNEFFDKVATQGEELLRKSAQSLQEEFRQGLSYLAEQRSHFGEEYSASASPFVSAHVFRAYAEPYHGDVFIWDIDKTYLQTHFSSLKGLAAIPFERAEDKRAIPGAVPILRALHKGMDAQQDDANLPVYFVSGSPPQLREVIQEKMQMDGVHYDGLVFKDQLGLVRAGRPRDVKRQIGYKLSALLTLKLNIPGLPRFFCFGDDVECDAEVFTLFRQVLKGMAKEELLMYLRDKQVHEHDIRYIFSILEEPSIKDSIAGYQEREPVEQMFIHLDRRTEPAILETEKVRASYNFLQSAMLLVHMKLIPESCLQEVAYDLRRNQTAEFALAMYVDDALRRFKLPRYLGELALRR